VCFVKFVLEDVVYVRSYEKKSAKGVTYYWAEFRDNGGKVLEVSSSSAEALSSLVPGQRVSRLELFFLRGRSPHGAWYLFSLKGLTA